MPKYLLIYEVIIYDIYNGNVNNTISSFDRSIWSTKYRKNRNFMKFEIMMKYNTNKLLHFSTVNSRRNFSGFGKRM